MEKKLLALVMVFVMASSVHAITITWTTVDYPGSSYTCISDIDGSNFVGIYDKEGIIGYPSFLYDGTWTPLDLPGAPTGISGGNIVGTYVISATLHGFIYDGTGWTTLDFPAEGIDGDNIVGSAGSHGIIYNLDSQTYTTLDYPDPGASGTQITDIDGENIVGYYQDAASPYNRHSFLYDGTNWTILDLPDEVKGISGANVVTRGGVYNLDSDIWTPLVFPGALVTVINGIDGDNIVGQYLDTDGNKHGFIATIPEPAVYYVDALDGNDDNDGLSPETPFATIQKAIDTAYSGDTVIVADGTYTGPGNRDIDFRGKAITVRSESGPENCVIDCNGTEAESHRGFYFHNGEGPDSVLAGVTMTNGDIRRPGGGAILCAASSPTITNCTISGNSAEHGGGIFCIHDSGPTITNCTISGNSAVYFGGGITCYDNSNPTITNCIITDNSAEDADGGGISCMRDSSPTITNCTITGNWGGIASRWGSSPIINNCTITGNSFEGIYCSRDSSLIINNSILWANTPFQIREDGASINVRYTDVQGGWEGESNMDEDPCFVEPGYWDTNGVWVEGDYYLLPDSLCIDTGDPNYIPEPDETDIDGNPRVINGRIDMGAYESNYIQAAMKFTPQMLNCNSKGKYIKAHLTLPEAFLPQDVDVNESAVAEPMGIESEYIKIFGNDDGPVRLEVAFDREAFCDGLTETGEVEITVIGSLTTSRYFYATNTIKMKPRR